MGSDYPYIVTKAINVILLKCWYSSGNDLVFPYIIRMSTVTASRMDKLRPIFLGIYPLQVEWLEKEITAAGKLIHT